MKHLYKLISLLVLSLIIFSCSQDDNQDLKSQTVNLKFETTTLNAKSNTNQSSITEIETEIEFIDGLPKMTSSELVEIPVLNSKTNETTYAYVLKTEYEKWQLSQNKANTQQKSSGYEFSVEGGYGFTGRCFEYGHFITGNNCVTLFVPCDFNCIGFDDVCPGWNEGFA